MESMSMSNPNTSSNLPRKKRRKMGPESLTGAPVEPDRARWRTEAEQQIYSSKLVDALRQLRRPESADATGRAVRDAADRVLAVSAKGKTRWSRAMLTGRLSLRLAQINRRHKKAAKPAAGCKKAVAQKKLPLLQRKALVLSRLVPGCRKLPLPNLLEETTDFIAALEMQVKAMTSLAGLLHGGGGGGPSADGHVHFSST